MCVIKVKVKACVYSPDISLGSADFTLITPRYWNSVLYRHLPGENAADFLKLLLFTQYQFSFHLVPITTGLTGAVWIQSLSKVFTHDQRSGNRTLDPWISGPIPSTRPRAPQTVDLIHNGEITFWYY